jgi:transcriptional regulator with XRE-family HTH domain
MLVFDGSKLKKLRQERKLKQRELALIVGKEARNIASYENGIGDPPAGVLLSLMDFFGVNPCGLGSRAENKYN